MSFKDHFSGHSAQYSAFRPGYPDGLFSWLSSLCKGHDLAWDCATGSGQAAAGLIKHFRTVVATDASANQIARAPATAGIAYKVASAEQSGIQSESADLITVAQALHWFDMQAFAIEADRVLKSDGVLAVWTYGLIKFDDELNAIVRHLYEDVVGDYWPFERQLVETGYSTVELPFQEIPAAAMQMSESWMFSDLIGYLNTWSAVKAFEKAEGDNPVDRLKEDFLRCWGDEQKVHNATWPLTIRAWRKQAV